MIKWSHYILPMCLIGKLAAGTIGITGVAVVNTSDADEIVTGTGRKAEVRSSDIGATPVSQVGNTFSFTNQFSWMAAYQIVPAGPNAGLVFLRHVAYDLTFTVEDSLNLGYTLSAATLLRGYLEASLVSGDWMQTVGTAFNGFVDTGSGFGGTIVALHSNGDTIMAKPDTPFLTTLVTDTASYTIGSFTGTRTFGLRFSTGLSPNVSLGLSNLGRGEGALRFGLDPTDPAFTLADYPGPDGEPPSLHGHFVTVNAAFASLPATPGVPEPATGVTLIAALAVVAFVRLRQ